MSLTKVFWAGAIGGTLLLGASFGAVWYAKSQPEGGLARAFEGAKHASTQVSPVGGLKPVLARLEQASSLKQNETDLALGLPDDPLPEGEGAIPEPDHEFLDPAPIVIPDTPMPPPMPPVMEEQPVIQTLPMPRVVVEQCPQETEAKLSLAERVRDFFCSFTPQASWAETIREPEPFPEAELPGKPEMREDPFHNHHHPGCPHTQGGCPRACPPSSTIRPPLVPEIEPEKQPELNAAAAQLLNELLQGQAMEGNGVETLELREADLRQREFGPSL